MAPAERRAGKRPGGPGLTLELDGEAGLTGGEAGSEEVEAAVVRTCEGTAASGGDSGHPGPIPPAERLRAARRRFTASRRSSGRLLAAAKGDGHGGELGLCGRFHGRERERERAREKERKKGGLVSLLRVSRGLLVGSAARRRWPASARNLHAAASSWRKRMTCICT
jgi:hypothetical protein